MKFTETRLAGAYIVDLEPIGDERGMFARIYCDEEMAAHGIAPLGVQINMSANTYRGTVRGLHYQVPPATEAKFIRCIKGAMVDVMVDLRPDSPTYLQHEMVELTAENRRAVYVPDMFAHGYQTLVEGTEVIYPTSQPYTPGAERGIHPEDPSIGIEWPLAIEHISDKDASWPMWTPDTDPTA